MKNFLRSLKGLFLALALSLFSIYAFAGWLGPDDPMQCAQKYLPKIRLLDARNLINKACITGYGDYDLPSNFKKAGRCIASGASDMYSFDSSLKVINNCTKDINHFAYFKNALYSDQNDAREAAEQRREEEQRRARIQAENQANAPYTIYDVKTGRMQVCYPSGGIVSCF